MNYLLLSLCVAALIGLFSLFLRNRKLREERSAAEARLAELQTLHAAESGSWAERQRTLQEQVDRLAKWQVVADAEAKAEEMTRAAETAVAASRAEAEKVVSNARAEAEKVVSDARNRASTIVTAAEARATELRGQANTILAKAVEDSTSQVANARNEATTIATEARQAAKALRDKAQKLLDDATAQAATIVDTAHRRAEEIAGTAYEAMKNASLYEQTVKAMKNIIEGYGDRYLIPERSLLDELADEFGHTEAGQQLKMARERTALMVRNGTAGKCEYVEANRRDTAIRFVVDAFNGKIDSILSRVKSDNYGTLAQEIRDAFTLVNYNGRAFREARVTEEFVAARLEELKWACMAQQLKLDEREEQRRIKEQIREEEKARREYERALKEAAKEEDYLRKAMEKAQLQIEKSSAEQRAKYEQQLQELALKLKEAEERSQRALSMAQQTKRGHVYVISNMGSFGEDVYKIGLTRRLEPLDRIRELGDASVPFEFDVHAMIFSDDAPALERQLHRHFVLKQMNKVNHRKEFFKVDVGHIREEIEKLGVTAHWTMTSEAKEYRESLSIEQAIQKNPALREAWINRQLAMESVEATMALVSAEEE